MPTNNQSEIRKQLFSNGYKILPNIDKRPALPGWNTSEYLKRELTANGKGSVESHIEDWEIRFPDADTTGVRVEGGLISLDFDIDDQEVCDEMIEALARLAPEVWGRAPTRYGSGFKVAMFAYRAEGDEPFVRLASRKYGSHQIEIFGGEMLKGDRCSRQFGVYGPRYTWDEGVEALHEVPIWQLPLISRAQCAAIIDYFDQLAIGRGWVATAHVTDAIGMVYYDITDETRFDTNTDRTGISYAELTEEHQAHGDYLRCSANFMPGRGDSGSVMRCLVGDANRHGVVGVWVPGDEALHLPVELGGPDLDALGDQIRKVAEENGIPLPTAAPNWRERYAESQLPKASLHNARLAIEALRIHCSMDTFHNQLWMGRSSAASPAEPLLPFFGQVTDASVGSLRVWLSNSFGLDFTERHVRDAVNTLCNENAFDPVVEMLADAQANWDGVERLDKMAVDYFNCEDTELNRQMVRKTMIAAVARARAPGVEFDTILTMESKEGWNKSSAWAVLAGEGNFSDASILGHSGREVQEHLASVWIHENAELAGIRKAEIEIIKAFASRQVDSARPAYGHFLVKQPRHSIEVGTTNDRQYLQSTNGNRRFWPIEIGAPIDLRKLRGARLQLWGEAAHYQGQGEALTLDEHLWAAAGVVQEDRRVKDPWEAKLEEMTHIAHGGPIAGIGAIGNGVVSVVEGEERVSTAIIFDHVLKIPAGQLHMGHSKRLADCMRRLGWTVGLFRLDGKVMRGYLRTVVTGCNGSGGVLK